MTACVCRALWNAMRLKPDMSTLGNTPTLGGLPREGLSTAKGTPSPWTASAPEKPPRTNQYANALHGHNPLSASTAGNARCQHRSQKGHSMTEFAETAMRSICRNPKCRSKLPAQVSNPREAFCARGCHSGFYRRRCLVCEEPMERKTEQQPICGKCPCRNALDGGSIHFGRYCLRGRFSPTEKPIKSGQKIWPQNRSSVDFLADRRRTTSRHQRERLSLRHRWG